MEHRLMTEDEKVVITMESCRLREEGRADEATVLLRMVPMPAYLAKYWKEKMGADFLLQGGWNLAEAEAEFGKNWLTV
jgi:hypothetical protein